MKTIAIACKPHANKSKIVCRTNVLKGALPTLLKGYAQAMVFTDSNVFALYGKKLARALGEVPVHVMTAGEENKTPETLLALLRAMAQNGLHRGACLVCVGGGVVGDIGGLASSLYMRGIACIQVPTTLLSQVDSSVGGKTAVDFEGVKNLIGAFKQPDYVLVDGAFLHTLSRRELRCGLGEIIKHGALNQALFDVLVQNKNRLFDLSFLNQIVPLNIAHKASVVRADERESGLRKSLNLGHTTAHAYELCENKLSHGEYVLVGTVIEAELAKKYLPCEEEYLNELISLCFTALEETPVLPEARLAAKYAMLDKKNESNAVITATVPVRRGEYALLNLSYEEYERAVAEITKRLRLC